MHRVSPSAHRPGPRPTAKLLLLALLSPLLAPGALFAQDGLSDAERQEKFLAYVTEAKEFYVDGDYANAIKKLQQANIVLPDDRVLINIAASYEKMDDCASAMAYYDAVLRMPNPSSDSESRAKKSLKGASKSCPSYSPDTTTGRITLLSSPPNATVKIDGETVGTTPMELVLLPADRHRFEVTLDGYKPFKETVVVGPRQDLRLDYSLEKAPVVVAEPDPDIDTDLEPDPGPGTDVGEVTSPSPKLHIPSLAMIGVGAVGLGAGAYINWGLLCDDCYYNTERAKYPRDSTTYAELTEERKSRVTQMVVATSVGALLVAGGITWFVIDRKKQQESSQELIVIAPSVSRHGAGATLQIAF